MVIPEVLKFLKMIPYYNIYIFNNNVDILQTWYYDYGWQSGPNINGPFTDNQIIKIPPVVGQVKSCCCLIL